VSWTIYLFLTDLDPDIWRLVRYRPDIQADHLVEFPLDKERVEGIPWRTTNGDAADADHVVGFIVV